MMNSTIISKSFVILEHGDIAKNTLNVTMDQATLTDTHPDCKNPQVSQTWKRNKGEE